MDEAGGRLCERISCIGNVANNPMNTKYKASQTLLGSLNQEDLLNCQNRNTGKTKNAITFMTSHMLITRESLPKAHNMIEKSTIILKKKLVKNVEESHVIKIFNNIRFAN